jgi:hypothetical protein
MCVISYVLCREDVWESDAYLCPFNSAEEPTLSIGCEVGRTPEPVSVILSTEKSVAVVGNRTRPPAHSPTEAE